MVTNLSSLKVQVTPPAESLQVSLSNPFQISQIWWLGPVTQLKSQSQAGQFCETLSQIKKGLVVGDDAVVNHTCCSSGGPGNQRPQGGYQPPVSHSSPRSSNALLCFQRVPALLVQITHTDSHTYALMILKIKS